LALVAEPLSRPFLVHEWQLTEYSLHAALSLNMTSSDILSGLSMLCKTELPTEVKEYISTISGKFGKVKMVLRAGGVFVEAGDKHVLNRILTDKEISKAKEERKGGAGARGAGAVAGAGAGAGAGADAALDRLIGPVHDVDDERAVMSFEINQSSVESVKIALARAGFPTVDEYDFLADTDEATRIASLELRETTTIRSYQSIALSKMFSGDRARSGIIVLPCGAGKTLVGIAAAAQMRRHTFVLCVSGFAVQQWKAQFLQWTRLSERDISTFTSSRKEYDVVRGRITVRPIVITTYSMLAAGTSAESKAIMDDIRSRTWGLMILDEVHVAPADQFSSAAHQVKAHCKLGLTATLVREDDKVSKLITLVGPKLYEANWMDLAARGFLASVECVEILCPMAPSFFREYAKEDAQHPFKNILMSMNPGKYRVCEYLIRHHEARGDKIIVFSDDVYTLKFLAREMNRPEVHGQTPDKDRAMIFEAFQKGTKLQQYNCYVNTFFISRVGDTSIDLPAATVIIQVSSHFGSRRQEAQRLGRILRPKTSGVNARGERVLHNVAHFYSLVSQDTYEMFYSTKRQGFLVSQGYSFKVITGEDMDRRMRDDPAPGPRGPSYATRHDEERLLHRLIADKADALKEEEGETRWIRDADHGGAGGAAGDELLDADLGWRVSSRGRGKGKGRGGGGGGGSAKPKVNSLVARYQSLEKSAVGKRK
jgi:DNA excision repair protein ERCC-3